jgi:hypothetical protein
MVIINRAVHEWFCQQHRRTQERQRASHAKHEAGTNRPGGPSWGAYDKRRISVKEGIVTVITFVHEDVLYVRTEDVRVHYGAGRGLSRIQWC